MTLAVTALVALPFLVATGLAGGAWVSSLSGGPPQRGALVGHSVGSAVVVWLIAAGLLVRTVGVTATSVWCTAGLLLAASLAVLRTSRVRAVLTGARSEVTYLIALVALSYLVWLPVGLVVLETSWAPLGPTPWYYWGLAEQVAQAGHIPATSHEWGTTVSFLDDYKLFSAATAALLVVGGGLETVQLVALLTVPLLGSGAALLARALGAGPVASLAAVPLAVGTGIGALRLTAYRPEPLGIGLCLVLVAVCCGWLRHGHRGSFLLAVCLAACLAQVHGIALLVACVLLVAASLVLCTERVPGVLRRAATAAAAIAGTALVLAIALGGASGTVHASGLADTAGPTDPTWEFVRAIRGAPPSQPPDNVALVADALRGAYSGTGWLVAPAVLVALVVHGVGVARGPRRDAGRVLMFSALWLLGLTLVGSVFALGWSGYVPRRLGASRLVLEATLLAGPLVAGALGVFLTRLRGRSRIEGDAAPVEPAEGPLARDRVVSAVAILAVTAIGLAGSSRVAAGIADQRPDPTDMSALARLPIPDEAVVLSNGYTEGYLRHHTGARVLLEGRAPYTFPELLDRANRLLRGADEFYTRPGRNLAFLEEHDVSYVLVGSPSSYSLATTRVFSGGRRLAGLVPEHLELVLARPDLQVYRVVSTERRAPRPRP